MDSDATPVSAMSADGNSHSWWRRAISPVVSVIVALAGFYFFRKLVPTLILALIPSLIASSIVGLLSYVGLNLRTSRQVLSLSRELFDARGRLEEVMRKSESELSAAVEDVRKTIGIIRIPEFAAILEHLERNDQNKVAETLPRLLQNYRKAWSNWGERVSSAGRESLFGWIELLREHLADQTTELTNRACQTSPEVYTRATFACAEMLNTVFPDRAITLFLITTMLPTEFYNWPQMEYVEKGTSPQCVAHTWKGEESYFRKMRELKGRVKIKRTIVVLDRRYPPHPNVKELRNLRATRGLRICETLLSPGAFYNILPGGLLKTTMGIDEPLKLLAKDVKLYPVGYESDFCSSCIEFQSDLLISFISDLHTSPDDAMYFTLGLSRPDHGNMARFLFGEDSNWGLIPEVALFRVDSEWKFGIMGFLRPFTEIMHATFLSETEMKAHRDSIEQLENGSLLKTL